MKYTFKQDQGIYLHMVFAIEKSTMFVNGAVGSSEHPGSPNKELVTILTH